MNEAARPARPDDLPTVAALGRQARAELRPFRGGSLWEAREALAEPLEGTYQRLLASPDGRVVVGTLDDVVLGYAVGEVEALADGRCLGRVHEVFVDEGARGVGLGEAIPTFWSPGSPSGAASASTRRRCPVTARPRTSSRATASWPACS
jgi:hypothetical protein